MNRPVVVIGGGFAGMAAACRLADAGYRPIVFEQAPRLGGRAGSFVDRGSGQTIDDGVHVLMRCCEASLGFLQRIRAVDWLSLQDPLSIPIRFPGGEITLRSAPLPGMLHLLPSLLSYRPLDRGQRIGAARAALRLRLARHTGDETAAVWLTRHGQPSAALERLWNPISVAALNAPIDAVDATSLQTVLRRAFLRPGGADMGFFQAPLATVFDRARTYVEEREGEVRAGLGVRQLLFDESGAASGVVTTSGEIVSVRAVVSAVPPQDAVRLFDEARHVPEAVMNAAANLMWSPIVNVHLWFDRPVFRGGYAMTVGSPVQAIFDVAWLHQREEGSAPAGQHLVLSQSAADSLANQPAQAIVERLLSSLAQLLPDAQAASCVRSLVVTRPRATFVPAPGHQRWRPGGASGIARFVLAGDWTSTGWPSTIESAVRSGIVAAARVEGLLEPDENVDEGGSE